MQEIVTKSCRNNLERFEKQYSSCIMDHNFRPDDLVLVCNTRIEESLNHKTKPRYLGPMVVVQKTAGSSFIVTELDGAQSELQVAGFRLVPYLLRTCTAIPIISNVCNDEDTTYDDPKDIQHSDYLASLVQNKDSTSL